jgi:L-2,4-diaminobutyrate decarboxylase
VGVGELPVETMIDHSFDAERADEGLQHAFCLLLQHGDGEIQSLPSVLPQNGIGEIATLTLLAPHVLGSAAALGASTAMAHMDPPTPWITWATTMWNASLNQNLLHPATAPAAREIEALVIAWLAPLFGMSGGHMLPGSTVANLTALWAARECAGVEQVVVADSAHLSIAKSAHLLGLKLRQVPSDSKGRIIASALPDDLSRSALVLTAGTTSTGAIDDLALVGRAAWTHVDAAWAGPMRLSARHAAALDGVEHADSVSISAHKWLFQPKESALVLFRDVGKSEAAISFGGAYLAAPNVGLLGSHGAVAVPLLATILAWGRDGLARRIDHCMSAAELLADFVDGDRRLVLLARPETGIVIWRPLAGDVEPLYDRLPAGVASLTTIADERWFRNVAANPRVDVARVIEAIGAGLDQVIYPRPQQSRGSVS